jgi:hypothetical protein
MIPVRRKSGVSLRLGLAALCALLAPGALALPLETASLERVPVQLSLPFAGAPAVAVMPAPALLSILPTAPPPIAAPTPAALAAEPVAAASASPAFAPAAAEHATIWGAMPDAVAKAFRSGDAREFWAACVRADFAPPPSDDAQQSLLAEGSLLVEADRIAASRLAPAAPRAAPARATKIDYAAFGRELARRPGLSASRFESIAAKRAILKGAGYTHLYGKGGVRIALDDAGDARIGLAFAETLRAYERRQER